MRRPYRLLEFERRGDMFCVRLRKNRLDEMEVHDLASELIDVIQDDGCRQPALALGPQAPECLYSVFLAKLITVQRTLAKHNGRMVLSTVTPEVHTIFAACKLHDQFRFVSDFDEAAAYFAKAPSRE